MGALIFGLFLWWIWPAADFDVKTVDYNMLTRIQEKIWKVAHGGLLGLFWIAEWRSLCCIRSISCMEPGKADLTGLHWLVR